MRQWQLPFITTSLFLCSHAHFLFSPKFTSEKVCDGDKGCSSRCRFDSAPVAACSLTDSNADSCYKDGNFTLTVQIKRELETQLTVMLMNKEDEDLVISITNDDVKVSYERIRDGSITTLTQVNEGHKFVTLVLGSLITLVLDDERPIVLERNVKFTSISSIESLDDEAVTLFKTTVLQNKGHECQCNEFYPVPRQKSCFTWDMEHYVSLTVTPRVVYLSHVINLSSTLGVTSLFVTTSEGEGVDRVSVDGEEISNLTQLRSDEYYEPSSRITILLKIESVSQIEIVGAPNSALSNIKLLANCGCEECNLQSNFTRCSVNTCTDAGTCSKPTTQPTPIVLTDSSLSNPTESARNVSEKITAAPTIPNKEKAVTSVAPSNKTTEVLPMSPDITTVKPFTEAAVRENSTESKVSASVEGGSTSMSTDSGSGSGSTEEVSVSPKNITAAPTNVRKKTSEIITIDPTESSSNVTFAPTENVTKISKNGTVAPTENVTKISKNGTVAPTENVTKISKNGTVAPTEKVIKKSENGTVAPTENVTKMSGNGTVALTENVTKISKNGTVAPTENVTRISKNGTVAPSENVTVAPTENVTKISKNGTVTPTEDVTKKFGNGTVAPTEHATKISGNVTVAPTENVTKISKNGTIAPTKTVTKMSGNGTVAPTENVTKISENGTIAPTTNFYTGLEGFTVDRYEEGDVYTRLLDTDLTLLIRLKEDRVTRTKREESTVRNFRTLFRTSCELNNCTQMSGVDVLSYRQVDKQTIEHTDTLQSFTAYVYTFVTEDVKITKEIVTSQGEPEVVDKVWTKTISEHQIQVNWEGVFRPNSRVISPGCFTVTVTAENVTTMIKTDLTSIFIEDNGGEGVRLRSGSVVDQMVGVRVPSRINNTNIVVEITMKTETGNVTAISNLPAAHHSAISRSVLILSIVFGVLGTLFLLLIFIYFIYRVRRNSAHSYHFNPNTLRQEYRPSEAERSKLTFNTNQSHSTIHHNRMCGQPVDPKEEGNTVFQVKRVNATENLLAGCQHSGAPRTPAAPSAPSHVTPAMATVLRYERTHSESSGTGSVTHCQTDIRDKAVTLTSQDGTSQTYL